MIKIIEEITHSNSRYIIEVLDNNKVVSTEYIKFKTCILTHKNNVSYYMLYDNEMNPISEVFNYLNFEIATASPNTKEKALYALKFLYIYLNAFNLELCDFNKKHVNNLQYFLKGISPEGYDITMELKTKRSNTTINSYFSIYRSFVTFLNLKKSVLLKKYNKVKIVQNPITENNMKVESYQSNLRVYKNNIVPKYISIEDFSKIISVIRTDYSAREECIVRLMFEGGLRLGEVLGLTADDLVAEEIDGTTTGIVYIRNRYSDKPYQHAKTCMKVNNKNEYFTEEYNTPNFGYQITPIDLKLLDFINEYIEEFHVNARQKYNKNYYKHAIADRVRESEAYEDDNYYIFLNSLGKPISSHSWNEILREIFIKSGISIDKDKRKNNLNHRFRHGFAMFLINYKKCNSFEVKNRMRHRSIASTSIYFNPKTEDIIEKKNIISKSLYDIIPELKLP